MSVCRVAVCRVSLTNRRIWVLKSRQASIESMDKLRSIQEPWIVFGLGLWLQAAVWKRSYGVARDTISLWVGDGICPAPRGRELWTQKWRCRLLRLQRCQSVGMARDCVICILLILIYSLLAYYIIVIIIIKRTSRAPHLVWARSASQ